MTVKTKEQIIDAISNLTVLELADLVKELEDKFGVSAAPAMMGFAPAGPAAPAAQEEEKDSFDLELTDVGAEKIKVIKVVRELTSLGLKEAKDLVDATPADLGNMKKDAAADAKAKLEAAGGQVTLK